MCIEKNQSCVKPLLKGWFCHRWCATMTGDSETSFKLKTEFVVLFYLHTFRTTPKSHFKLFYCYEVNLPLILCPLYFYCKMCIVIFGTVKVYAEKLKSAENCKNLMHFGSLKLGSFFNNVQCCTLFQNWTPILMDWAVFDIFETVTFDR